MDDLISRQAAIDALGEKPLVWDDLSDFDLGKAAQWSDDVDAIKELPSKQPKIIRCKECKHYKTHTLFGNSQSWCERWCDGFDNSLSICTEPDDYCSYGEEIEDEQSSIQKRQEN